MKLEAQQAQQAQEREQQEQLRLQQQQQEQLRLQQQAQEQQRLQQQQAQQHLQEQQHSQPPPEHVQQAPGLSRSNRPSGGSGTPGRTSMARTITRTHVSPQRSSGGKTYNYGGQSLSAFSVKPFRWPKGHHYVRFTSGMKLPHVFQAAHYVIDNFVDYGLNDPPAGFEWVRFGPDALLVNMQDGVVTDSAPDMFQEDTDAQDDAADGDPTLDAPSDDNQPPGE